MIKNIFRICVIAFTASFLQANAQRTSFSNTPVVDITGRPVYNNNYQRMIGSPYIIDAWVPGEVVTADGKLHKGMLLKYNIEEELLTFVYNTKEEPLKFAEPVTSFTLFADKNMSFANNFPKIDGYNSSSYYEVVALGKTMLLKHYRQRIKEQRGDDLSLSSGVYVTRANYYVFKDGKMVRFTPEKASILTVLADKAPQLNTFMAATAIDYKKDEDLKKVFDFYNGL